MAKHKNKLIIVFFVVLFLLGLKFIPHVGVYFDENPEQNILRSNVREYAQLFKVNKLDEYYRLMGVHEISGDIERDHGISAYYLFTPTLLLKNISEHYVSVLWHLYTYMIFFIGVIYFYRLIKYLFKDDRIAIISTALYHLTPRVFIDGLYNNKDIVLLSFLIVMIYYGLKFIYEKDKKSLILFSIASAFVCNTKVIGLLFLFIIGAGYIIKMIADKEFNRKNFIYGLTGAVLSLLFYIILTPAIWGSGHFKLIEFIQYCLSNSVNFSRHSGAVLFEGTRYNAIDNPLPWYYLPKMMMVTLPIITSILFLTGIGIMIYKFVKDRKDWKNELFKLVIVICIFLVPFITAIVSHPVIYNGWRHFYFLYGPLMIFVSYAVYYLFKQNKIKKVLIGLISITLIFNLYYIFRYGVANTGYYNVLVNRNTLGKNYELDYYNVTSQEAVTKFLNSGKAEVNDDGLVYIYGSEFNHRIVSDLYEYTNEYVQSRIKEIKADDLQAAIDDGKVVYDLTNQVYTYVDMSNYELAYTYKIFGSNIIRFYKMR